MLMDEYFSAMKNVLTKAENTQREAILAAADEIANRLEKGGAWHIMDTGHMLMFEAVGRTGGMMAIKPIKITCEIQNPVRYRPSPARGIIGYDSIPGFADYVLGRANVLPEDVIMIGSVSGYNYFPVDLAIKANEMGCATIALTSVEYSSHLTSKHPGRCACVGTEYLPGKRYQRQLSDVGAAKHSGGKAAGKGAETQCLYLQPYAECSQNQR